MGERAKSCSVTISGGDGKGVNHITSPPVSKISSRSPVRLDQHDLSALSLLGTLEEHSINAPWPGLASVLASTMRSFVQLLVTDFNRNA